MPAIIVHTANNATAIVAGQFAAASVMVAGILAVAFLPLAGVMWLRTRQVTLPASPLASVPAAAPAMTRVRATGLTVGAVILAVSLLAASLFNVYPVRQAGLEPDMGEWDLVIVAVDASRERALRVGDIVEFDRALMNEIDDRRFGRVLEAAGEKVLVDPGSSQLEVRRDQIVGKVVWSWRR